MQNSDETQSTRPERDGDDPINTGQLDKTEPTKIEEISRQEPAAEESPGPAEKKPRRRLGRIILLGIVGILVLGLLGGVGGYFRAVDDRVAYQDSIVGTEVADQFLLGLIEYERGEYEIAHQRFEYILKIDPNNKPAADQLTKILLEMASSDQLPTPMPTSTPGVIATPDNRRLDEVYDQIILHRNQQDWDSMLMELDSLRSRDMEYKAVELDGLYYVAYRNRGLYRIQVEGNLEGGIFDINRAELYGPLDIEASNYRDWASSYITGVSFWEIDWDEVLNYLSPLAISAPFLSDSSQFTVQDRVATAQVEVNLALVETARYRYTVGKWCDAYDMFNEAALSIQLSADDLAKFENAKDKCYGVEPTEATTEATTETTPEAPTEAPTEEPTATPEP